ncbi:MAG: transposase [Planctomycetes bacterium]|nr:transposase [Planctomycetota bacterium]
MPPILHVLAVVLAGWLNRHQQRVLEYVREENRVLKRRLGRRKLRLTDDDRARLAVRGVALSRGLLDEFASIVTPETILRWHRQLVAKKWTFPSRQPDRKLLMQRIAELAVRFARENPSWRYDRIQGALANLGHVVAPNTINKILKRWGIDPAPVRKKQTSWRPFLRTHAASIAAGDFFSTEVWSVRGLVTWYTFFVIDLATRAVTIAGSTPNPDDDFMKQVARNLTDCVDGFLRQKRFLILDRDGKFSEAFRGVLENHGIRMVLCPARAPNCHAFAERFVRSIKSECLSRMIFIGAGSLRHALAEFVAHYTAERPHQGIGNVLIEPGPVEDAMTGRVANRRRLGGLLSYYHRLAA